MPEKTGRSDTIRGLKFLGVVVVLWGGIVAVASSHFIDPVYFIVGLIVIACGVAFLFTFRKASAGGAPTHICTNCHSQVWPTNDRPGSFGVELALWLCFLVPGFVYSIWRLCSQRVVSCPVCKARNPVPLNSPAGQALATLALR